ncbi:MAG: ankyrin repeat domain-containing protein [Gammaproteobacteria bacterium]|nr:ankyrin repeat domain-containing protein [Gammaproteobacteria bacterium]
MNRSGETTLSITNTRDPKDQMTEARLSDDLLEPNQVTNEDNAISSPTLTSQTDDANPTSESTSEDSEDKFKLLSAELIAHIGSFLDLTALVQFQQVDTIIQACLQQHLFKVDFWREKLLENFHIPLEISNTFAFPHLVHKRLTSLANQPDYDGLDLFKKIRYAFSAPGYDPLSMPWLFFPFTIDSHKRFINQLNDDGEIFQSYYLDMGCRVGNSAFVQFMVRKYGFKLNSERLKYACMSGDLDLVRLFTETHKIKPSKSVLNSAVISGNVSLVEYLTKKFKFKPSDHTLDCSLLSGNCETVEYLRDNYQIDHGVNALNFAITGGNTQLLMSLPDNLTTEHVNSTLSEKTISIKLVQHLVEKKNFKPTQKTLDKALAGAHHDLVEFLITTSFKNLPNFLLDFSCSCLSGNIEFVKKIIKEKNQVPDLHWLLPAIFSGNVLLVQYLIETYALDPRNIDFWRFKEPHICMEPYLFCHVPMAKFLIEEHGCIPNQRRFEDYIRGNNLPLARYLITECGFKFEDDLLGEMNPDNYIWLDGGPFEQLIEIGRNIRLKQLRNPLLIQYRHQQQLSSNPLFCAFKLKESYRFEQLQPDCDLSASGETFISAMSLFIRERFQNYTYLEMAPPCSHKKQNTQTVLQKVAESVQKKFAQTGKSTKKILIPFTIDKDDREWHLLELSFDQNSDTHEKSLVATIYSTKDYLYCRKDDPNRSLAHEWTYVDQDQYTPSSEEQILDQHFSSILTFVQVAFGPLKNKTYRQSTQSSLPNSSVFSVLMKMLSHLRLINSSKMYEGEKSYHRLNYKKGGSFFSTLAMAHWRTEVLGFLFVNLNKIPDLLQKGFGKTDDTSNLESSLTSAFYEEDKTTPKLVSYTNREGSTQANKKNVGYFLLKEAFLETYEFDGYDAATKEFTPALPEDPNRRDEFPTEALTFWTALAIFFGIPNRPEKASLDEGAVWTGRQYVRNFFGGWNPAKWDLKTNENNIEGKVLLNFILLFILVKIAIPVFKLVTIPFKTTLNIIKLFTEFLPTLARKITLQWSNDLYLLRQKKIRHARGFIATASAYVIYGSLSFFNFVLLITINLLFLFLRTGLSPEKSARMAWKTGKEETYDPVGKYILGTGLGFYSYLGTFIFWTILVAVAWSLAIPFIAVQFPSLVALFTTITHAPVISSGVLFIKSSMISLWGLVAEINIPVINLGLIFVSTLTLMVASRLSDDFSNAWARWLPAKSTSKVELPDTEKAASKKCDHENDFDKNPPQKISESTLVIFTGYEDAEQKANTSASLTDEFEHRVDESPLNTRTETSTPLLDQLSGVPEAVKSPDLHS